MPYIYECLNITIFDLLVTLINLINSSNSFTYIMVTLIHFVQVKAPGINTFRNIKNTRPQSPSTTHSLPPASLTQVVLAQHLVPMNYYLAMPTVIQVFHIPGCVGASEEANSSYSAYGLCLSMRLLCSNAHGFRMSVGCMLVGYCCFQSFNHLIT